MAVTYAWRLDANKYAYLIDPNGGENGTTTYGYVSKSPLNGTELASVAETANNRFGVDAEDGFAQYKIAFDAMVQKINDEWGDEGAQFYDLLSADVYYNVDASHCADLKGVGIRGVRYLGASAKYDPLNPIWDPSIKQDDTNELAGKFSIYGIYMEDQDYEKDNVTLSPENIFAVYNGSNGRTIEGDMGTSELQNKLEKEIARSTSVDTEHSEAIVNIKYQLEQLTQLDGGDFSGLLERISKLEEYNKELKATLETMEKNIEDLQAALEAIQNPDNNTGGGVEGGGNTNVSIKEYGGGEVSLVGVVGSELYILPDARYENGNITATAFYQE